MRMTSRPLALLFIGLLTLAGSAVFGELPWPAWRGDGSGIWTEEPGKTPPIGGTTIEWMSDIHGHGYSSPIVADERVFLTAAHRIDLQQFSAMNWLILIFACCPAIFWLLKRFSRHHERDPETLFLFLTFALAFLFFEAVQRVPALSARWLAGSYGIRIWLLSAFVGMTGLVTAASALRRSRPAFGFAVMVGVCALLWIALMVPDRDDASRLGHRWIFWTLTISGVALGFSRLNFKFRWPFLASAIGAALSSWCVNIMIFGHGHLAPGFWIIAGVISFCTASWLTFLGVRAGAHWDSRIDRRPCWNDMLAALCLTGSSGLIFWNANYGRKEDGMQLDVVCYERSSGALQWQSGYSSTKL